MDSTAFDIFQQVLDDLELAEDNLLPYPSESSVCIAEEALSKVQMTYSVMKPRLPDYAQESADNRINASIRMLKEARSLVDDTLPEDDG